MKKYFFVFVVILFMGAGCSSAPETETHTDTLGSDMDSELGGVMVVDELSSVEVKVNVVGEEDM
ncbi:MAG: hypothetical protein ABII02_04895 [Candidatus Magasanikbacteria bacterium]